MVPRTTENENGCVLEIREEGIFDKFSKFIFNFNLNSDRSSANCW